jgi:hypothetical protein
MTQQLPLKKFYLLVLIASAALISCNDSSKSTAAASELSDTTTKVTNAAAPPVTNAITPGVLDILYIEKAAILAIPNGRKLVFQYIFERENFLTLHGWISKQSGVDFDTPPNIKLKKGSPGDVRYGVNTYFGNTVIRKQDIHDIQTFINAHPGLDFVLFKPVMEQQHIKYEIYLSDDFNDSLKALTLVNTGKTANPSPPRTY